MNENVSPLITTNMHAVFEQRYKDDPGYGLVGKKWAATVLDLANKLKTKDILDYGCGQAALQQGLDFPIQNYDPCVKAYATTPKTSELVVCSEVLEYVSPDFLPVVLKDLLRVIGKIGFFIINTKADENIIDAAHGQANKSLGWWHQQLQQYFFCLDCGFQASYMYFLLRPKPQNKDPLRIFIGSEPRMHIAEKVLRYSIQLTSTVAVDITSMDYSQGGVWEAWDMGRPVGQPARLTHGANADLSIWFTDFTNFRWAIPELCGFKGRAVYMDADILVRSDVAEFFNMPLEKALLALHPQETSVILFDCEKFSTMDKWPSVTDMKTNRWAIQDYLRLLNDQQAFGQLPVEWNCLDGDGYSNEKTRLVHYTDMSTQPWRPYPDEIEYHAHAVPAMETLWYEFAKKARTAGYFLED